MFSDKLAGITLTLVWKTLKVEGYDADVEYITPKEDVSQNEQILIDDWYCKHVYDSQYYWKCYNSQMKSAVAKLEVVWEIYFQASTV